MRVGDVYYAHCSLLNGRPKKKYLVLICSDEPLRIALINTVNAVLEFNNPALGKTQVFVEQSEHEFLAYDSWLDCSRLLSGDTLKLEDLAPVGRLVDAALHKAIAAIDFSPTIAPRQKKRCVESIQAELSPPEPPEISN